MTMESNAELNYHESGMYLFAMSLMVGVGTIIFIIHIKAHFQFMCKVKHFIFYFCKEKQALHQTYLKKTKKIETIRETSIFNWDDGIIPSVIFNKNNIDALWNMDLCIPYLVEQNYNWSY